MRQFNLKSLDSILKFFNEHHINVEIEHSFGSDYLIWIKTNTKEAKAYLNNLEHNLDYKDGRAFFFLGGSK